MSGTGERLVRVAPAMLPGITVAIGCACLLPVNILALILTVLTAWTCASVPIGVLVGHCALSED